MIEGKVDLRGVNRALKQLGRLGQDLRPLFREARKPVLKDQREHRAKKQGPDGAWPLRAEATTERYRQMRRRGRKPPARLLGRLPTARKVIIERRRMVIESTVKWSMAHFKGKGRLPKREWFWISGSLLVELATVAKRKLEEYWAKAAEASR